MIKLCLQCKGQYESKGKGHKYCLSCAKLRENESKIKYAKTHPVDKLVKRIRWKKWYSKNKNNLRRDKNKRRLQQKLYVNKYPEKELAHRLSLKIPIESNCKYCNSTLRLERHHPDYNRPLEFLTLCKRCHTKEHYGGN